MNASSIISGMGRNRGLWPVLSLLLLAVLIPAACLLWFMNEAIANQQAAMAQQRAETFRTQAALLRERVERYWEQRMASLDEIARDRKGAALFGAAVRANLADSVICLGERDSIDYPAPPAVPASDPAIDIPEWTRAARLEETAPAEAAQAYRALSHSIGDANLRARAVQAETRCRLRTGRRDAAVALILRSDYGRATDLQGRLIAADAAFLALSLIRTPADPRFTPAAKRLAALLNDYDGAQLAGSQRLFLMRQLRTLTPVEFATLEAEEFASRYLEAEPSPVALPAFRETLLPGIWKFRTSGGRVLALLKTGTILERTRQFLGDSRVTLTPPGAPAPAGFRAPLAVRLPGWQITLSSPAHGGDSGPRRALYLWTAALVIAVMSIAALFAARLIQRQAHLARLKTDLVASVSHELKTPIASISVLVDTLLDGGEPDPGRTREYLELIARENARLSRLIDNFLTFSRIERNRYPLDFAPADPREIITAATEAAGERFRDLEVTVEPGLSRVQADFESMVTVLLNLLDNAHKYSPGDKRIGLRAASSNGSVCFAVQDHGIGIPPREIKRIFRKFYRVDQRLSRSTDGCGLGLSIVDFIVRAHRGSVTVRSTPGEGSTFEVRIPVN